MTDFLGGAVFAIDAEPDPRIPPAAGNMATIGQLDLSGFANGLDLEGDHTLHVGNVYEGWTAVDVTDPAAMTLESVVDTPGAASHCVSSGSNSGSPPVSFPAHSSQPARP